MSETDAPLVLSARYSTESHWMLDEQPDTTADLLLDWFAAHPAASSSI